MITIRSNAADYEKILAASTFTIEVKAESLCGAIEKSNRDVSAMVKLVSTDNVERYVLAMINRYERAGCIYSLRMTKLVTMFDANI